MEIKFPEQVDRALALLHEAGFEAYAVGGCVRDIVMGRNPDDFDITTSALPEETKQVFDGFKIIETGIKHGTVSVIVDGESLEITTYRVDGSYSDGRHPDEVSFSKNLAEDLKRRDFTINAMAFNHGQGLIDPFDGRGDIQRKVIRCVGEAGSRFKEDSLRILRALRFASTLGFEIEGKTQKAAFENKTELRSVSAERVREEICKLIFGTNVRRVLIENIEILGEVIPELLPMKGFEQRNPHHIYDVLEHTAAAVSAAPKDLTVRLAALFHDIGKPACFSVDENGTGHFYGHAEISAAMTDNIMRRLRFGNEIRSNVVMLVRFHDRQIELQERAVKRALNKFGDSGFSMLFELKKADNAAQAPEYSFRMEYYSHLKEIYEKIMSDKMCFSIKNLAVNGNDIMKAGVVQGPEVGRILSRLLDEVIEGILLNEKDVLIEEIKKTVKN